MPTPLRSLSRFFSERPTIGGWIAFATLAVLVLLTGDIVGENRQDAELQATLDALVAASQVTPTPTPTVTPTVPAPTPSPTPVPTATPVPPNFAEVIESVRRAVLLVETDFASGTGFLLTADGRAATSASVTGGQRWVAVTLDDGARYDAQVVREDRSQDIAILELTTGPEPPPGGFPFLDVAGDLPLLGADIGVVGYPVDFVEEIPVSGDYLTVHRGIVSGLSKIQGWVDLIRTDADYNLGHDGAPVVDSNGSVVGMVSSYVVRDEAEGVGFAIGGGHVTVLLAATRGGGVPSEDVVVKPGFCPARNEGFTVPPIPNIVSGALYILGDPAIDDIPIVGRMNANSELGECWTDAAFTSDGEYSLLIAYPDGTDVWFPVELYAAGFKVAEISEDRPDHLIELDLYLPPDSAPTPTPTPFVGPVATPTPTPTPSPGAPGTLTQLIDWPSDIDFIEGELRHPDGTWVPFSASMTSVPGQPFEVQRMTAEVPSFQYTGIRVRLARPGEEPSDWIEDIRELLVIAGAETELPLITDPQLAEAGFF